MVCISSLVSATVFGVLFSASRADSSAFEESCVELASSLAIPNTEIRFSEFLANGTKIVADGYDETCTATGSSPSQTIRSDLCRVGLLVHTSSASNVTIEAWLPLNWTGRFLSGGVGGLTGCIQFVDLNYGAALGFATVSHNNGHNGTSGAPFYNNPGILEDYVYRATVKAAQTGKRLTAALYGRDHTKAYFMGCSGGGRQGFMLAQRFPDEYDGIIAACPAFNFVNFISWGGWLSTIAGFYTNSTNFITGDLWEVIHDEIMNQCDHLDGAVDGILEDPDLCHPNFETLICSTGSSNNTSKCLSGSQAARVREIYQPLYGLNGDLLYPRLQPGPETLSFLTYLSGTPSQLTSDWYQYAVYNPSFDTKNLSRMDMAVAGSEDPYGVSSWMADLSRFSSRGGKILALHGLEDGIISSEISRLYYHRVAETMSLPPLDLDSFYRYFRVSGLSHCSGGSGAGNVGMYAWGGSPQATPTDPDDNILMRIVAWVERDEAPEFIRGSKFSSNSSTLQVEYKRKHCRYPKRNVLIGPGNYTDENAWHCQ